MLAKAATELLPKLDDEKVAELNKIYSAKGLLRGKEIITFRPYREVHSAGVTPAALFGGGARDIKHHLYGAADKMKVRDEKAMERFKRSADNARNSGIHARHAHRGFAPLNDPMTLEEGREYIQALLERVLRRFV